MINISVRELSDVLRGKLLNPRPDFLDRKFLGVSIDTRTMAQGNLFVALTGERQDGHDFVGQAVSKKASAFLAEENKARKLDSNLIASVPTVVVKDTRLALQELARYYRGKFNLPVIAITGTNGKTTTKEMMAQTLSAKHQVLKSPRSFNTLIGVPLTILELSPQTEIMVLEMGASQPGEISKLAELAQPTLGLILNIGPAHLQNFGSLENVARAKFELLDKIPIDKPAFLNLDDPFLHHRARVEKHRVISFAVNTPADYQGLDVIISGNGHIDFKVRQNLIRLDLLGRHNIYNALATYAVADYFELPPASIKEALESFRPAHLRMEVLDMAGATIISDCYNANPASMQLALETLQETKTSGKRMAVLGDMLELGEGSLTFHQEIGRKVAELRIDYLVTVGELAQEIAATAIKSGMPKTNARKFSDNHAAGQFLLQLIKPGDTVLLKGSRKAKLEELLEMFPEMKRVEN